MGQEDNKGNLLGIAALAAPVGASDHLKVWAGQHWTFRSFLSHIGVLSVALQWLLLLKLGLALLCRAPLPRIMPL